MYREQILFSHWLTKPGFLVCNGLSIFRLAASWLVVPLISARPGALALSLTTLILLSDGLDGWIARTTANATLLGHYLDRLADVSWLLVWYSRGAWSGAMAWLIVAYFAIYLLSDYFLEGAADVLGKTISLGLMIIPWLDMTLQTVRAGSFSGPLSTPIGWLIVAGMLNRIRLLGLSQRRDILIKED